MRLLCRGVSVRPLEAAVLQKSSANSDAAAHLTVGADAYIGPAECAVFMEIFSEFVTSQRADVGIGPYKRIGMSLRIRRGFFNKSTASRRAEQSPAPTNYGWLTRSNKERSRYAFNAA